MVAKKRANSNQRLNTKLSQAKLHNEKSPIRDENGIARVAERDLNTFLQDQ
jgi:hypothetical protein